jgi:DNA invertase Pin-like site-specific DNA recombinase
VAAKAKLQPMPAATPERVRCAIYTRKSTDEGLEQDFNTLDAQREAGEALICSQRGEGWTASPDRYDDGGFTGANMDRPALKRLLADVEAGIVNCVVVYKVDRLSRSLLDFTKIMEILDKHGATFVSVTQQFNTTTSLGRLTLNMLLSFAQFEREMISERTRDKMHAARRKGKWIGGNIVLGYDLVPKGGAIIINRDEARCVREIFDLYLRLGSLIPVIEELLQLSFPGYETKERLVEPILHRLRDFLGNRVSTIIPVGLSGRWDPYLLSELFDWSLAYSIPIIDVKPPEAKAVPTALEAFRHRYFPSIPVGALEEGPCYAQWTSTADEFMEALHPMTTPV